MKTHPVQVRTPLPLYDKLKRLAADEDRSVASMIRVLLDKALQNTDATRGAAKGA